MVAQFSTGILAHFSISIYRNLGAARQQEDIARLRAEERQCQIQGFRTRQGAQSHGGQTRKHVGEASRDTQDKDRFNTTRHKEADTDRNPTDTDSAVYRLSLRHHLIYH